MLNPQIGNSLHCRALIFHEEMRIEAMVDLDSIATNLTMNA